MPYPKEYRYTREHEWVRVENGRARVGITDHAQHQLGDIVYVELPKVGTKVKQMQEFATVESVKAVSPIYAPVSGEVVEINQELENKPELINQSPHEQGWIVVIAISNPKELESLLTAEQYEQHIGT
ncbi:MAG: glycine cleavage system protein GcvH [Candidatus Bipolaricaulota bacterium]|nr:glycine cleavage system protein GcvH [Candidatus Bipolaricaulota bacterium]MDW8110595.1 glycine cleavage system protein GcvH [Candidatus Bipolaricaulota bacterium]MDW8329493.1 glycine cleavage system protein GcvH [Candidatus Bipolaricaulota bacterium]